MSEPAHNQGDIGVSGAVQLSGQAALAIGHGAVLNINQVPPEVKQLLEEVRRLTDELHKQGIGAGIAPIALPATPLAQAPNLADKEPLLFIDPSASAYGTRVAGRAPDSASIEQLSHRSSRIDELLKKVDQHMGQPQEGVGAIDFPQQRLPLVEIRLQQGNLALWQFRRASARLFGAMATAEIRARADWPAPPEMQALSAQAHSNLEVLRGIALLRMVVFQRPDLLFASVDQLSQGRWQEVLDGWSAAGQLPAENARRIRTQIESIGEVYRPAEVDQAVREAEAHFSEALRLQPQNTTALVNLATLLAESMIFTYIASGQADRPRLRRAHELFQQARVLLSQRDDHESKIALGKCLFSAATTLPAEAMLESVQWAAQQTRVASAVYSRQVQQTIRWDVAQRNLAISDPSFYSSAAIQQARTVFIEAGDTLMAEQCGRALQSLEQTRMALPLVLQQLQMLAPVVGTWRCQIQSMFANFQGILIFDADGQFYWQTHGSQQMIVRGQYQVMGSFLALQGIRWIVPLSFVGLPAQAPTMPFLDQLVMVQNRGNVLLLRSQQDGSQIQCQRL